MAIGNNKVTDILFPAKCPKCGGMFGTSEKGKIKCKYCGSEFFLTASFAEKEEVIRNYYELASTALSGRNDKEAYSYYTKILEISPKESVAWLGKGMCASSLSTLSLSESSHYNPTEYISCFEKAIEVTPSEVRDAFAQEAGRMAGRLALTLYNTHSYYFGKKAILDLLFFWETKEPDNLDNWKHIVLVADYYGDEKLSKMYSDKIRAKYDPNFLSDIEERNIEYDKRERKRKRNIRLRYIIALMVIVLIVIFIFVIGKTVFHKTKSPDKTLENAVKYIRVEVDWGLPVRATPKPDGKLIKTLKKGEQLPVISAEGDWREVRINGETGWVRIKLKGETLASEITSPPIPK